MLAPEPYLSACLAVLSAATAEARSLGWSGERGISERTASRLVALMEAVHNVPHLIQSWERVDEARLRRDFERYDDAWGSESHARLLESYEKAIAKGQA